MRRARRRNAFVRAGRLLPVALLGLASLGAHADHVARGDRAWAQRAEGERDGAPRPDPIREAVDAYERALAAEPASLEARWKLLRALHFAAEFATRDAEEQRELFDRARAVAERGLEQLAQQAGSGVRLDELDPETLAPRLAEASVPPRDVARLYFWSAIHWGAWSRTVGLLRAVRAGVANRLFRYAHVALALEPAYEAGGPLRLLARLHASLPRVPFVAGWVDRAQAVPLVERAHALAPEDPGNRLLLALTLLELAPERRHEALALLEQVEALTPRPSMRIEDLAMRREARARRAEALAGERA